MLLVLVDSGPVQLSADIARIDLVAERRRSATHLRIAMGEVFRTGDAEFEAVAEAVADGRRNRESAGFLKKPVGARVGKCGRELPLALLQRDGLIADDEQVLHQRAVLRGQLAFGLIRRRLLAAVVARLPAGAVRGFRGLLARLRRLHVLRWRALVLQVRDHRFELMDPGFKVLDLLLVIA